MTESDAAEKWQACVFWWVSVSVYTSAFRSQDLQPLSKGTFHLLPVLLL